MVKSNNRGIELAKNTVIIGIGNVFSKALSFLLVPLFTAWLTPDEYGKYDLLYSYVSLVVPVLTLQIEQAIMRFSLDDPQKTEEYLSRSLILVSCNSLILVFIACIIKWEHKAAFVFCTCSYAISVCFTESLRGSNNLKQYSIANILTGIGTFIYSFIFVYFGKQGVSGLLAAFACAYLTTVFYIIFRTHFSCKAFSYDIKGYKPLLDYSLPLLPNALSWWVTNVSDRTLIAIFLGEALNGIYAVSCKMPTLIAVFYGIFNLAWQQSAILSIKDSENERTEFYKSTFNALSRFLFSSAICIIAFTPLFYDVAIDVRYRQGMKLVPVLIMSSSLLNLAQYFGGILLAEKKTGINGKSALVAAIINFFVNISLIRNIGLGAAAGSTFVSYVALCGIRLVCLSKYFNIRRISLQIAFYCVFTICFSYLAFAVSTTSLRIVLFSISAIGFVFANAGLILSFLKRVGVLKN